MKSWFVLSAIGRDRPGLVSELAQLIFDSDANLEDSRMTILGSDFAVILLGSHAMPEAAEHLAVGAKRLERDHGLTILVRPLEKGPPSLPPSENARVRRVRAAGQDKAGIVAGVCRTLAEHGVNITELVSRARPGPGGEQHYELDILVAIPETTDEAVLRRALEAQADDLVIDLSLETP